MVDADDTVFVITSCLFGAASIIMFILGLALGRIRGTKQTIRWVAALLALVACGVVHASLSMDQPQSDRPSDGVTRVWGRWANWAFSYTLMALLLTLGCMVRLRDIIAYPVLMLMVYIFMLFGSLPDAPATSFKHWIWLVFAAVAQICAIFALFYVDFGIGYDSKADVEAQKAVYKKDNSSDSFGYRRGTVIAVKIVWVVITVLQMLFWCLAQEVGGVFGYFVGVLVNAILDVFAVGAGAFLLFWIMDPERNNVLRSADISMAPSAASGDIEESGDASGDSNVTEEAVPLNGGTPPVSSQASINGQRPAASVAASIYNAPGAAPAGKAGKSANLNFW